MTEDTASETREGETQGHGRRENTGDGKQGTREWRFYYSNLRPTNLYTVD